MKNCCKQIAAVILWQDGNILIGQRQPGGACSSLWEFPGGKVEAGETYQGCAVRECQEELGVKVFLTSRFMQVSHRYGDKPFSLQFFWGKIVSGKPQCRVHQRLLWVPVSKLSQYNFCPANQPVIERLMSQPGLK